MEPEQNGPGGGGIHISDLLEDTSVFLQDRDGGGRKKGEGGVGGGRKQRMKEEVKQERRGMEEIRVISVHTPVL